MRRIRFIGGQRLRLFGVPITLLRSSGSPGAEVWEVENRAKRQVEPHSRHSLDLAQLKGNLVDDSEGPAPPKKYFGTRAISDLPPLAKRRVYYEREIVRSVERLTSKGHKTSRDRKTGKLRLEAVLAKLAAELGLKHFGVARKLSVATYYVYVAKHRNAVDTDRIAGGYSNRGFREPLGPGVKAELIRGIEELIDEKKGQIGKPGYMLLTQADIDERIVSTVERLRAERGDPGIRVPHRATVFRILKDDIDQYDLTLVRKGTVSANVGARYKELPRRLTHALQWCQFDETHCPIFLYHEALGIPLGKPHLAWIVDLYSGGLVGIYLGFTPPSDHVIAQTVKHACLPKAYMYDLYPGNTEPWLHAGIMKLLTFDNSLQGHGDSIQQICGDIDIQYDFTPSRAPWMKAMVERMFKMLEEMLLQNLSGYTFPKFWNVSSADYDPQKTALMDFGRFLALLHAWITMGVHTRARGKRAAPNRLWVEGTASVQPEFVSDTAELEALFGVVRKGVRLDHRGVLFEGLRYDSDLGRVDRRTRGAVRYVNIKCNLLDIRKVHIQASDGSWYPATTHEHPEMEVLDHHVLKLLNAQSRYDFGVESTENRVKSLRALRNAMVEGYDEGMAAANLQRGARVLGIGTPNLFVGQGHDGRLPVPTPPPLVMPPRPALVGFGPKDGGADDPPLATRTRTRLTLPVLKTDRSL